MNIAQDMVGVTESVRISSNSHPLHIVPKYTPWTIKAVELRAQGLSYQAIADIVGHAVTTVWAQLNVVVPSKGHRLIPRLDEFPTLLEGLYAKAELMPNGCLEWRGGLKTSGYGQTNIDRRGIPAHCAVWIAVHGEIPDDKDVLHKCDNPPCIREDHLFLGTHIDNMRDMVAKDRTGGKRRIRQSQRSSALTDRQIRCIHAHYYLLGMTPAQIGALYQIGARRVFQLVEAAS